MGLLARLGAASCDRASAYDGETWVDGEVAGCKFRDERLGKLLEQIGSAVGESIPFCARIGLL